MHSCNRAQAMMPGNNHSLFLFQQQDDVPVPRARSFELPGDRVY